MISNNGTQFTASVVREACLDWGIQQAFSSVEHLQINEKMEAANRVILRHYVGVFPQKLKWPEKVSRILLAYDTIPQSTTRETSFSLVYGTDAVLPVEIEQPTLRVRAFSISSTEEGVRANLDTLEELREAARISNEAMKRRVESRFKTKVVPRLFKKSDLVLRKAHPLQIEDKLSLKGT